MKATPAGFKVSFTQPVDAATASDVKSYAMQCWTYHYHSGYGDKQCEQHPLTIKSATAADDGLSATIEVEGLAPYYVHELRLPGVRNRDGAPLLHPVGYYTLNRIPK